MLTCHSPGGGGELQALRSQEGYLTRQVRPSSLPETPSVTIRHGRLLSSPAPEVNGSYSPTTVQFKIFKKEDNAMTTVPVHCLYSLYSLKHCINIVLNATSYETMYDSIALQTNKQTMTTTTTMTIKTTTKTTT